MSAGQWAGLGVALLAVVVVALVLRVRDLRARVAGLAMELECVRRRVGVSDGEVREYHYEQHPECRPNDRDGDR